MPPRKGIVKSGNAGNSSKSKALPSDQNTDKEPSLFPPGSKYPLSLLNERCQKLGWDKPIVETRQSSNGHSFVVILSRTNKKTSERESVRMEPYPPYTRPSALEARHWGATYALYRFCNGIQLNHILPPGSKEYWKELADAHKTVPDHQKWMYHADPFAAQKEVRERQEKAAKLREGAIESGGSARSAGQQNQVINEFSKSPEVRMASSLRELVEDSIKTGFDLYPEAMGPAPTEITPEDSDRLFQQLSNLGFSQAQIRDATSFLSNPSPFLSYLLKSASPLEASIEYLVLHVPECDLPERFFPSQNTSNPFITSAHSGGENLRKRWMEDKAIKEAGFPPHAVKRRLYGHEVQSWDRLVVSLGNDLTGNETNENISVGSSTPYYKIEAEEFEALGATLEEPGHLVMPLFSAPIQIHISFSSDNTFPRPDYAPLYITSSSIAAYVRLHLLSRLLVAIKSVDFIQPGEGFCMAVMRVLEEGWALVEEEGPPSMVAVFKNLLRGPEVTFSDQITFPESRLSGIIKKNRVQRHNSGEIANKYNSESYIPISAERQKLPAFKVKDAFLECLENNRVVVVVGETGCGKTTQLPQYILDSMILSNRGSDASIIITQPRRISAISVAARVSYERREDGSVGYAIRGESKRDKNTKLLFCTTGVVLRRLASGDDLDKVSHIIVDEVHERSVDGDFLLLELKGLLKRHPRLKVILMSATINHETFIKYFDNAPLLSIPGAAYPVVDKYLEDVVSLIQYRITLTGLSRRGDMEKKKFQREAVESQGFDESSIATIQAIANSDRVDYQFIAAVMDHIITTSNTNTPGGILIFLSGISEIRQCIDAIREVVNNAIAEVFPLHANLSNDEQRRVFEKTSKWKIVAATNVAETSITIDDITYVIDTGKVKENRYDPGASLSRLVETWVTRAAARQRRGRAGRTRAGTCYKLYTKKQEMDMLKFPIPEILRVPLESILLTVKVAREEDDAKSYLSQAIDPPNMEALNDASNNLIELGALDQDEKLTPLGRHMSSLPLDVRLAKILILGTIFKCLDPVLTIAASLSSKPLFLSPMDTRDQATAARARFMTADSDILTDLKAYDECTSLRKTGKSANYIKAFCEQNFISTTTVREITVLRQEFASSLNSSGLITTGSILANPELNINSDNLNLLKAVILGGLWPRVARINLPDHAIKFDKLQSGTIQRENTAKEYKFYDLREGRVFLHPGSILFDNTSWKQHFLVYFLKYETTKIFLRDATTVPLYALLLFGGPVSVDRIKGGIRVGNEANFVRLRAIPRIGVLVNQLRRLLDAQLERCVEEGTLLDMGRNNPVIKAILGLLSNDGLSG